MVLYRRNYSRRYSARSRRPYRPYRRSISTYRPYRRYSTSGLYRRRSIRPYSRYITNRTRQFTTNRWGNKGTSRYALKNLVEMKKQVNAYAGVIGPADPEGAIVLSELVLSQGVTEQEFIGRKLHIKYQTLRCNVELSLLEQEVGSNSIRFRLVLAWRQNKINTTYGSIIGDPTTATGKACLFDVNQTAPYNFIAPYLSENNGTWHVVYDKKFAVNNYTKDSVVMNISYDKNRPVSMESTMNPGEYHDSNRQFTLLFIPDRNISGQWHLNYSMINEIGFYDP